jgi:hypothetical protein
MGRFVGNLPEEIVIPLSFAFALWFLGGNALRASRLFESRALVGMTDRSRQSSDEARSSMQLGGFGILVGLIASAMSLSVEDPGNAPMVAAIALCIGVALVLYGVLRAR